MIQLGKIQSLKVLRTTSIGVYLGEGAGGEADPLAVFARKSTGNTASITETTDILLPKNEFKEFPKVGETIEVFIYKDSEDRPIATCVRPKITLGEIALLRCTQVTKIGAFLDWGLKKDLFLPFKEQNGRVSEGDECLVCLYIDKSSRLAATMKVYHHLSNEAPYSKGDWVDGIVYDLSDEFGAFVAVDCRYSALIPKKVLQRGVKLNEKVRARVSNVMPDGRLELSLREVGHIQLEPDSKLILEKLQAAGGSLPYNDRSDAAEISEYFGMSKAAFKRACGHLFKERIIRIEDDGISIVKKKS